MAVLSSGLGSINRGVESHAETLAYTLKEKGVNVALFKGGGISNSEIEKVFPCIGRNSFLARVLNILLPASFWRFGFGTAVQTEGTTFAISLTIYLLKHDFALLYTNEPPVAIFLLKMKQWGIIRSQIVLGNGTNEDVSFLDNFELDYSAQLAGRLPNDLLPWWEKVRMRGLK
jgi:hypothetical protein